MREFIGANLNHDYLGLILDLRLCNVLEEESMRFISAFSEAFLHKIFSSMYILV